ncbi:hypothetical protein ABAC460_15905 [Asticcacaulis sp. AC460]|uniref:hypothetical protein n=1 Tax=Asticcacaulis sp. AC460 TaxID=1282360 RepID=UPI0003C3C7CB|nr:hypothetical protein [Asticcacaulis sp. AC460]ESQ88143.1 hypothetical protein ABAC460_15905 [Asticcacaulis sp. AC460]
MTNDVKQFDASTGQFIDPMFAVVIATAVNETFVAWVKLGKIPSLFELSVVSVGYVNLLLSWFGYHKSIISRPIQGGLRFFITVILLPLYMVSIILYNQDFKYVAGVYFVIFFMWTIWEICKHVEYKMNYSPLKLHMRSFNLLVYIAFLALVVNNVAMIYFSTYFDIETLNAVALFVIFISIIILRVSKSPGDGEGKLDKIRKEVKSLFFGSGEVRGESEGS